MKVLVTDHPWPDTEIEGSICAAAGHELIAGLVAALPQAEIERLVAVHEPHAIMCCWATVSAMKAWTGSATAWSVTGGPFR